MMTDYSEQEFNEHCARLDGFEDVSHRFSCRKFKKGDFIGGINALPEYFNDLNLLMPLFWEYADTECFHQDDLTTAEWKKHIRDCLMQIPMEGE